LIDVSENDEGRGQFEEQEDKDIPVTGCGGT
jgi:hypothetical protein